MNQVRVFQMFDPVANHNKFWRVEWERLDDGGVTYRTSFGRVGGSGQTIAPAQCSEKQLVSLIRSKEAKGYRELKLHQPDLVAAPEPEDNREVRQFWGWVHQESVAYINSYLAMSVGNLSQEQIAEGRRLLDLISQAPDPAHKSNFVRDYYNVIPTRLPRKIDLDDLTAKFTADEQEDRLLQLEAAIANDKAAINLGVGLSVLESGSGEYNHVLHYINSTLVHGYKVRVQSILSVHIPSERGCFETNKRGMAHRELLFHGTRNQNVRHILHTGLIVPRTASNGRMFGNGIYFANKASKSVNYCWSSGRGVPLMLFVAEVALGKVYTTTMSRQFNQPPRGHDSVMGKAGHTKFWLGSDHTLYNDEFIVYSPSQQTIRYVITFEK